MSQRFRITTTTKRDDEGAAVLSHDVRYVTVPHDGSVDVRGFVPMVEYADQSDHGTYDGRHQFWRFELGDTVVEDTENYSEVYYTTTTTLIEEVGAEDE